MTTSSFCAKKIQIFALLALLASFLLAGLGLLCLKEAHSHQTLKREYLPLRIFELLPDGTHSLLFSDPEAISLTPSREDSQLVAENPSPREISLHFGESSFLLPPNTSLSLPSSVYSRNFSAVDQGLRYDYVCDAAALEHSLHSQEKREIIFQNDILTSDPITFSSPCRIDTRSFRMLGNQELLYRSETEGSLTVISSQSHAILLYAYAPKTQIHTTTDALCYPQELWDYYLKAESVNGRMGNPLRNPIVNEAMLQRLANSPLLPPREGSFIEFHQGVSLTADLHFSCAYSLHFLKEPQFNKHTLSFATQESQTIRVTTTQAIDSSALLVDAPNSHLIWEGQSVPSAEILCDTMNVASINGEDPAEYRLGGNCEATLLSFTLHHESFVRPISLNLQGNLLVGTPDYLDSAQCLTQVSPHFEVSGGSLTFSSCHRNADGTLDLTKRTVVELRDDKGQISRYRIEIQRKYHDLPVITIETERHAEINSKTEYVNAKVQILANGHGFADLEETAVQIRGRGNSTWEWEKKPYKLKFSEDLSLFGLAPSNEWVLLSNYADKSLIRNRLALEMAKELNFDYTSTQYCADVFLNGEYQGVYTFGEHLEADEGRVELADSFSPEETGYLIEIGGVNTDIHKKGVDYFHAGTLRFAYIKSPEKGGLSSAHFDYISDLLIQADQAVVSGGDWRQYLDEASLIDWILLSELTNNTDCAFRRSCYFTKNPGEKIKMGPVWDFDLAFGNFNRDNPDYNTWASTTDDDYVGNTWLAYLLQDEAFVNALHRRWTEIGDTLVKRANQIIDETQETLSLSAQENFRRWDILNIRTEMQHSDVTIYNTHEKQLQYLKDFLHRRSSWLTKELTRMANGGRYEIPVIPEEN